MRTKQLLFLLGQLSQGRWRIAAISAILPLVILVVFAVYLGIKYDYILLMSLIIACSTLLVSVPLFIIAKRQQKNADDLGATNSNTIVRPSIQWSEHELLIWENAKHKSRSLLQEKNQWGDIQQISLDMLAYVANEFDKKALDFSIPEGLQLLQEVSLRYQHVIKQYIPGAEIVKVSYLQRGYDAYEEYGHKGAQAIKFAIWANYAKNLYLNPAKFTADFIKDQSSANMTKGLYENMLHQAKQALLDEVVSVAIDLYSGRFSFTENEVLASNVSRVDATRIAQELEPIRIVFVGQTGAGKSSIVNVLKNQLVAQVDVLPSTDQTCVYKCVINNMPLVIVDLPGLDGEASNQQQMLQEMSQADLVIWVLKANQPARDLDKRLKDKFDDFYIQRLNISRRKPAIIGVINQVDKLKPIDEWQPPYNIIAPVGEKATLIEQAVKYNQKIMQFNSVVAMSLSTDKLNWGVEELKVSILEAIIDARNTQLNRQRVERIKKGVGIKQHAQRAMRTSGALLRSTKQKTTNVLTKWFDKRVQK